MNSKNTLPAKAKPPGHPLIIGLYAAFGIALLLSLVPSIFAGFFSMILFLGVLIGGYWMRAGQPPESFRRAHASHIISTIWMASLIMIVTLVAASVLLYLGLDHTPLHPCLDSFIKMGSGMETDPLSSIALVMDPEKLFYAFGACLKDYITVNLGVFITSFVIAVGPVLLYCIVRFARGLARALEGRRFDDQPKVF